MTGMSRIQGVTAIRPSAAERSRRLGGLLLLLTALVLSVASSNGSEGDRAETGQCPAGEVCSPETPSGLYFKGAGFGDDWLFPDHTVGITAVGGTQTIEIDEVGLFQHAGEFAANCSGAALSVASIDPPFVRVHADAAGTTYLRILDPANGELYDRLSIEALPVTGVEVLVAVPSFFGQVWTDHPAKLYYGGRELPWLARLKNGDLRLVDETLVFTVDATNQSGTITSSSWDRARILPAVDATRLEVTVTTGAGARATSAVDLVQEIDRIEVREGHEMPTTLDASQMLLAGLVGLTADDQEVANLDWAVTAIGPGSITTDRMIIYEGVLAAQLQQVGVWQLEVSAANVTRTFLVVVTPPAPAPVPPPSLSGPSASQPTTDPAPGLATPVDAPDNAPDNAPRGAAGWRAARALGPLAPHRRRGQRPTVIP